MKLSAKTALGVGISEGQINMALLRRSAKGIELVKSTFAGDASLLAWAPIGNAGPVLAAQE